MLQTGLNQWAFNQWIIQCCDQIQSLWERNYGRQGLDYTQHGTLCVFWLPLLELNTGADHIITGSLALCRAGAKISVCTMLSSEENFFSPKWTFCVKHLSPNPALFPWCNMTMGRAKSIIATPWPHEAGLCWLCCPGIVFGHQEKKLTCKSWGNAHPQSSQLTEPLWTDPLPEEYSWCMQAYFHYKIIITISAGGVWFMELCPQILAFKKYL